jgi:hypothetical protein
MTAQDASLSPRPGARPHGKEHEEEDIEDNPETAGSRAIQSSALNSLNSMSSWRTYDRAIRDLLTGTLRNRGWRSVESS